MRDFFPDIPIVADIGTNRNALKADLALLCFIEGLTKIRHESSAVYNFLVH